MVFSSADNRNPNSLASRLRRKRTERFIGLLDRFPRPVKILDVGGTSSYWVNNAPNLPEEIELTILNVEQTSTDALPVARSIAGDARNMAFADLEFDICFSNSVIEHVGTLYDQMSMAREIARVAGAYYVQTPNRYFPIEPHFLFPGWQFLPLCIRHILHSRFDLGWLHRNPDWLESRADVEQIRLLTRTELSRIFPSAVLEAERIGPFVKSWMVIREPSD